MNELIEQGADWITLLSFGINRWVQAFLMDLARYLIGVGLVTFILLVAYRPFSVRRRIQPRRANKADIQRELFHSLVTVMVYASVAVFTIEMIELGWTRLYMDVSLYGLTYLIATIPMLLVLHDAYFYWAHRLMHQQWLFRRVHRIHHLSRTPTSWAAYSFSVWEALAMTLFVPLIMFVVPLHPISRFV
ncbi:MAG: sterol desaturase family protein, partial [Proteobacteria bacterium]|nr:sterol desaturase family protein [Pseudomonadota bacterium]